MRMLRRAICWALIAAVCSSSRVTRAAEPPLALGSVEYEGEIPDYFQREFEQAVVQALESEHRDIIELRLKSCDQIDCALDPAREAKSAAVIFARISRRDRDYEIRLIAHAVDDGAVIAQVTAQCSVCGQAELLDMLPAEVSKLRTRTLEALSERVVVPPRLTVDGTPGGARLRLDGDELGASPLHTDVETGRHALEITAPGHAAQIHRWVAVANVEEVVHYELEPMHAGRPGGRLRAGGWVLTWLGVGGIGAGAALLVLDGRPHQPTCAPDLVDVNGACPNVYTTASAGAAVLGVAVASLGAGIGLLVHGYRQRDRATRVQFTPGSLQLRF